FESCERVEIAFDKIGETIQKPRAYFGGRRGPVRCRSYCSSDRGIDIRGIRIGYARERGCGRRFEHVEIAAALRRRLASVDQIGQRQYRFHIAKLSRFGAASALGRIETANAASFERWPAAVVGAIV